MGLTAIDIMLHILFRLLCLIFLENVYACCPFFLLFCLLLLVGEKVCLVYHVTSVGEKHGFSKVM